MLPQLSIVLCRINFKVILRPLCHLGALSGYLGHKNRKVRFVGAVACVSKKQYNIMKNIIKSHWKYLAICLLFVFIAGFAGTYVQFLKGKLLDTALDGVSAGVFRLAIVFFAAIAVEMALFYGYDYFRGRFSVANKKSLRGLYFDWLLMRSPVEAMTVQQGEFVAQYTDQIDQVNESYLDNIPLLIEISSKALIVSAALFWLDYRVALLTLFLLTMPLYIPKLIEKKL